MNIITHLVDAAQGKHPLGTARTGKWPAVRAAHLKLHPACAVCGGFDKVEAHHIKSFFEHPEFELSGDNIISLCESNRFFSCHRIFGHCNNFQQINPTVRNDAQQWRQKIIDAKAEMLARKAKQPS